MAGKVARDGAVLPAAFWRFSVARIRSATVILSLARVPKSTVPGCAEKWRGNIRSYYGIGWIRCEPWAHESFPPERSRAECLMTWSSLDRAGDVTA